MHDAIAAERLGTPAVGVMTSAFADAAEVMARALGMPDYRFALIDHPVSSASEDGLTARAQSTIDAIRRIALRGE